jgi:Ca2+-binding RTX toxin-like protein
VIVASIGMNLSAVNYWGSQFPFIDRFKTSGEWQVRDSAGTQLKNAVVDMKDGYPLRMPDGAATIATSFGVDPSEHATVDTYRLTWEGSGAVTLTGVKVLSKTANSIVFESSTKGDMSVFMSVKNMSNSDPMHDIHVVRTDQIDLFDAGEIFNPAFLAKAAQWDTLRFMDWMGTNKSLDVTWSDRSHVDDASWAGHKLDGVPLEIMVRLANETGTDMWWNAPSKADDTYVRNALEYIRDNLDDGLKVHVEYSNEVWNTAFGVNKFAVQQANGRWGTDANKDGVIDPANTAEGITRAAQVYYGYRSAQIAKIAHDVFGGEADARLETVLATQATNATLLTNMADGVAKAGVGSVSALFDEYAITTYFGDQLSYAGGNAATKALVLNWAKSGEAGMAAAFQELEFGGSLNMDLSLKVMAGKFASQAAVASSYGLQLVAYEGGAHITPTRYSGDDNVVMQDFINRLMNDPRMGELYAKMATSFEAAGGGILAAYADIGANGRGGYWGNLDSVYQANSARNDALLGVRNNSQHGILVGTEQDDMLQGTDGDDRIVVLSDTVDHLGRFLEQDWVGGGAGADTIYGGLGNDHIYGLARATSAGASDGGDLIFGGAGNDYIQGNAGNDRLSGGIGNDRVYGGGDNDTIFGDAGMDYIQGNKGRDLLSGGAGDDTIRGGAENDTISGGPGLDTLFGDAGADLFTFEAGDARFALTGPSAFLGDIISDFGNGRDQISLGFAVDTVAHGSAGDAAAAKALAVQLFGDSHVDVAAVSVGADTYLFYGSGVSESILLEDVGTGELDPTDFV